MFECHPPCAAMAEAVRSASSASDSTHAILQLRQCLSSLTLPARVERLRRAKKARSLVERRGAHPPGSLMSALQDAYEAGLRHVHRPPLVSGACGSLISYGTLPHPYPPLLSPNPCSHPASAQTITHPCVRAGGHLPSVVRRVEAFLSPGRSGGIPSRPNAYDKANPSLHPASARQVKGGAAW